MNNLRPISKLRIQRLALASMLLLGTGYSSAQTAPSQELSTNDPFASIHASLSTAADRVLEAPERLSLENQAINSPSSTPSVEPAVTKARKPTLAMQRVQQLRPVLEPILREEGIPTELSAVVLVESGGQPYALSPKGARGIWQFMPNTARRYGLIVSPNRDERLDIQRSTHAAARYLRDLYGQFGDWQLALAAYNAGEGLMQRVINRNGTRDFAKLSSGFSMPLETRKYVPAVFDATRMFSQPSTTLLPIGNAGVSWNVYAFTDRETDETMK